MEEDYDCCWCLLGFHYNHCNSEVLLAKKKGRFKFDLQFLLKIYPQLTLKIQVLKDKGNFGRFIHYKLQLVIKYAY